MEQIYHGRAVRAGVAIAAAARLRTEYGVPSLDPQRLRRLGERLRRFSIEIGELEQVILVADTLPAGFALAPIPGLEYVGVAAQTIVGEINLLPCPAVADLPDILFTALEEDEIVIIDGDRGRVYVAPDAPTLARYQAPLRRSRRFFLDSAHLPARTASENRAVVVLARVRTQAEVSEAIDNGADGIWLLPQNDLLGGEDAFQTVAEQSRVLQTLIDLAIGKPLFFQIPTERLALSALTGAAVSGALCLILEDLSLREEIGERLVQLESLLEEQDLPFGTVSIEAGVSTLDDVDDLETLDNYAGLCVIDSLSTARMERVLPLAGLARHGRKPLTLLLPSDRWETELSEALDLRADRVVVSPTSVADVKDAIRVS